MDQHSERLLLYARRNILCARRNIHSPHQSGDHLFLIVAGLAWSARHGWSACL